MFDYQNTSLITISLSDRREADAILDDNSDEMMVTIAYEKIVQKEYLLVFIIIQA